jgi:hypothetical protein
MSSVVISGDTSGAITLAAPAVAGTNTITLPASTGTVVVSGQNSAITAGTAVASTSGTSIDFTSIPSWVKRITVMFNSVSTNSTSLLQIQLGTSSGITTSGYNSSAYTNTTKSVSTSALLFDGSGNGAFIRSGAMTINNFGSNIWCSTGAWANSSDQNISYCAGSSTLNATLDRVRITTVNGTDTFDAGSINILYE